MNSEKKPLKKLHILSPIFGKLYDIKEFQEDFFSSEFVGPGVFIDNVENDQDDNDFYAPFNGKVLKWVQEENVILLQDENETIKLILKFFSKENLKNIIFNENLIKGEPFIFENKNSFLKKYYRVLVLIPRNNCSKYDIKLSTKEYIKNGNRIINLSLKKPKKEQKNKQKKAEDKQKKGE